MEASENKIDVQRSSRSCEMFFSDKWCQSKTLDRNFLHDLEGENNPQSDFKMKQCSLNTFDLTHVSLFFSNLCILLYQILEGFFLCVCKSYT